MKAIVVTPGKANSAQLIEMAKPELRPNEILVKTIRVGIDGTDREINDALYGMAPDSEDFLVLGHEALGKIVEIGSEAKNSELKEGDIIVPLVRRPDDCPYCQKDMQDMCIKGDYTERGIKGHHGYLSEFFTEVSKYLIKIPGEIKDIAVLLEPLSIVEKGIRQAWNIQKRIPWEPKKAIVLGLGAIGILGAMVLKAIGLDVYVYSMEPINDPKVELIQKPGIKYISASQVKMSKIPSLVGGNLDFILEATGNSSVALRAMSLIGINGVLCLTSVTGGQNKVTICADCLNLDLVLGNKVIFGTVNANRIDFEKGIEHLQFYNEKYPRLLDQLITKRYNISEFKKAIEEFKGLKTVIEFED